MRGDTLESIQDSADNGPLNLRRLASWIRSHGLTTPVQVIDGAVHFVCHDGGRHEVTTFSAAREALGY